MTAAPVVPLDLLCASGTSYFGVPGHAVRARAARASASSSRRTSFAAGTRVWFFATAGMKPGDGSLAERVRRARRRRGPDRGRGARRAGRGVRTVRDRRLDGALVAGAAAARRAGARPRWRRCRRPGRYRGRSGAGRVHGGRDGAAGVGGARRGRGRGRRRPARGGRRRWSTAALAEHGPFDVVLDPVYGVAADRGLAEPRRARPAGEPRRRRRRPGDVLLVGPPQPHRLRARATPTTPSPPTSGARRSRRSSAMPRPAGSGSSTTCARSPRSSRCGRGSPRVRPRAGRCWCPERSGAIDASARERREGASGKTPHSGELRRLGIQGSLPTEVSVPIRRGDHTRKDDFLNPRTVENGLRRTAVRTPGGRAGARAGRGRGAGGGHAGGVARPARCVRRWARPWRPGGAPARTCATGVDGEPIGGPWSSFPDRAPRS